MKRISRNLTTIYRTERLITRRRLAVVRQQTVMMALAGIAVLAAMVLLNVSLFFALQSWMSSAASAAVLALGNLCLAGVLMLIARHTSAEEDIAPAVELRDMAIADIEDELDDMAVEAREVVQAVKGFAANPLGSLPALLVPILASVLKDKSKS